MKIYLCIHILRIYRIPLILMLSWRHEQQTIDHGDINAGIIVDSANKRLQLYEKDRQLCARARARARARVCVCVCVCVGCL